VAVVLAVVVSVSGAGVGAYALTQTLASEPPSKVGATALDPFATEGKIVNVAPDAVIVAKREPLTIKVSALDSTDSDGEIVAYAWDFGDGKTSDEAKTSHKYKKAGTYLLTLTVTDDDGASATVSREVTVKKPEVQSSTTSSEPEYGHYPSGYPMPRIPGTDAPDTSACQSGAGYTDSEGVQRCL
jgi:PKD repeat protein